MSTVAPHGESRPLAVSAAGVVSVFLIHALLVLPFILNLSLPSPRRPHTAGAGATAFVSSSEADMTVVFIDEPSPAETPSKPPTLASRGKTPPDLRLIVLSPDPLPPPATAKSGESDDAPADTGTTEGAEHAKLYGRYLRQLQARIDRAWLRPRTEIGAPQFSCRVRIQQDRRGGVISVSLDRCNGTGRWQQSLVNAIRTASPLPAPPDASVYADVLWLSFTSGPFEDGGSAQGFEPEIRLADATDRSALESFRRFANESHVELKSDDKKSSEVIHLTIIGTPAGQSARSQLPVLGGPTLPPIQELPDPPPQ